MFFSKYRLKKNIMNCDKPLMERPSEPLHTFVGRYNYRMATTPRADRSDWDTFQAVTHPFNHPKTGKREAFMICALTRYVNQAVTHYKLAMCPNGTANLNETYTVFKDPSNT